MKCRVIAEIGWNHMGDMNLAKKMIDAAVDSGADCVKFQTWSVDNLQPGTWDRDGRREIYEKAELTAEKHNILFDYCKFKEIDFLTSVFNIDQVDMIHQLGCKEIKIASCEALNFSLINKCLDHFDRVIISTGGLTQSECSALIKFSDFNHEKITLLHCVSMYPCPDEKSNMGRMKLLQKLSKCDIGYSDHTAGVNAPYIAICNNAVLVEKHFTIDNSLPGRDNLNACLPGTLKSICEFRDLHSKMHENATLDRDAGEAGFEEFRGRWSKKH